MADSRETPIERLHRRAEEALDRRRLAEAETLLDRLAAEAEEGSYEAVYAHRNLAELRLERNPWRAALHIRRVLELEPEDDVPHAMMGLCQALLGNYRASVAAYRRALRYAPRTPWYLHNLGHLLDVALDEPKAALEPLRTAWRLEPEHDEIVASLAHCLARLGELDEAGALAREAAALAPRNADHQRLIGWINRGAPEKDDLGAFVAAPRGGASEGSEPRPERRRRVDSKTRAVRETFEREMRSAGFSAKQVARARALWRDFRTERPVNVGKPEVFAAAIEYAMATITRRRGTTQAKIARRYGVAPTSVSSRYAEIRDALDLEPGDPRYVG
ncbi:MAG: hypothetical protein KF901_09260 [Myxococcales bacterium]|nr:hypothetical protein [Myxococcales bacterium]